MIREIGSEFWTTEINSKNLLIKELYYSFLLTGRTALEFIIQDIKVSKGIKSVYLPSYCCHTMIRPFVDNNISVEFYDVNFEKGKFTYEINYNNQCDTVLILKYFGFTNKSVDQAIGLLKASGKTVIEDATHSCFLEKPYNKKSDYVFASLRKWTGLACGAYVAKNKHDFSLKVPNVTNLKYIELREAASIEKKKYIETEIGDKNVYLDKFREAEELIENDYRNYSIPINIMDLIKKLDINKIKNKRKINAKYLTERLKSINSIETIILCDEDVPLFVPIIVNKGKRDALRNYLMQNDIYCPIHWPISNLHNIRNPYLYNNSLSIVCDQRYEISDMNKIVDCINSFQRNGEQKFE